MGFPPLPSPIPSTFLPWPPNTSVPLPPFFSFLLSYSSDIWPLPCFILTFRGHHCPHIWGEPDRPCGWKKPCHPGWGLIEQWEETAVSVPSIQKWSHRSSLDVSLWQLNACYIATSRGTWVRKNTHKLVVVKIQAVGLLHSHGNRLFYWAVKASSPW